MKAWLAFALLLVAGTSARAIVSANVSAPSSVNVNQSYTVDSSGSDDQGYLTDLTVTKDGQYLDSVTAPGPDGTNFNLSLSDNVTAPASAGTTNYVATVDTDTYTTTGSATVTIVQPPSGTLSGPSSGLVGVNGSYTLSGTSNVTSYTWAVSYNGGSLGTNFSANTNPLTWGYGSGAGTYVFYAILTGPGGTTNTNTVTTTVLQPASFSGSPTSFTYNGSAQGPSISANPSGATYSLSGTASATAPGSYSVTATATGSYSGSNTIAYTISAAGQSVSLTPASVLTYVGGTVTFTASGSQVGGYQWSVPAGASSPASSAASLAVTFNQAGASTLSVVAPASADYTQSNTASATIHTATAPVASVTSSLGNTLYYGQTTTFTAAYTIDTADGDVINNTAINVGPSGTLGGYGGAVTSLARSALVNWTPGVTQQIYAYAQTNGNGNSWTVYNNPLLSLTIDKAAPAVSFAGSSHTMTAPTYTVQASDLAASFTNPYTSGVSQPAGTVTYAITGISPSDNGRGATYPANGSTISVGQALYAGIYTLQASYPGDGNYTAATATATLTITNPPPVNVSMTASNISYGQTASYTLTVSDANGDLVGSAPLISGPGIVSYSWEGKNPYGQDWNSFHDPTTFPSGNGGTVSGTVGSSPGHVPFPLPPGTYYFSDDAYDLSSYVYSPANIMATFTVAKATPATTFASQTRSGVASYTVQAADLGTWSNPYSTSAAAPTGTVTYTITGATGANASPTSGPVAAGTVLQVGTYTIQASYPGDANYNAATATATFTVTITEAPPTVTLSPATAQTIAFGQSVTFTTTATDPNANMTDHGIGWDFPDGTQAYTVNFGGNLTDAGCQNHFSATGSDTRTCTFTPVPYQGHGAIGNWSVSASAQNAAGWANSTWVTVTVTKAAPALQSGTFPGKTVTVASTYALTAGDLNAAFGNPYNAGVAAPTGAVTYAITAATGPYATPVGVVSAGTALKAGTYTITATYPGDANYNAAAATATFTITLDPNAASATASLTNDQAQQLGLNPYQAAGDGTGSINLKVNTPQ